MGNVIKVALLGDATKLNKAFQDSQSKADKWARGMNDAGRKMTMGLTLPIAAGAVAAFKMASDVDESLSQVGQVFGEEADKVIAASENINDAFSQADFLAFSGNLGDIAQGLGIAADESDDMALSVLDLSQDLSSFKNVPVEQAVGAITSALAGERESLKSLGIVIKDVDVKQRALEMGLWDGTSALTSAAQAQATMSLVTEKSANSIGDFDRTSEGAANTTKIATANLKDMAANIGTQLLPIGSKLLTWVSETIKKFTEMSPEAKKIIVVVLGIAAAIGPVLMIGAKLIKLFGFIGKAFKVMQLLFMLNPFTLLIVAVIALAALIYLNWDKIVAFMKVTWDKIKEMAAAAGDWIKEKWVAMIDWFKGLPGRIAAAVSGLFDGLKTAFKNAINWIIGKWNDFKISIRLPKILGGRTLTINTPNIPTFHDGGTFTAPGGASEGLAILKTGERVQTEAQQRSSSGGGGGIINLTVNAGMGSDGYEVGRQVVQALQEYQRSVGALPLLVKTL
jgi:hypothetical protein